MARSHGQSSVATQGRGARLTVALSVLVAALIVAGPASVAAQTDDSSAGPSASPLPLVDTVTDGLFELSVTTPKDTWAVGEPIEVSATLAYVGTEPEIVVAGGLGLVGFGIEQLDGPIDQSPGWRLPCKRFAFDTGEVQSFPFRKSGGYGADDAMAPFWERWFDDPQLRPPAGTYRLYAVARYGWPECGDETTLTASVTVEVVETSSPEASPSSPAEAVTTVEIGDWTVSCEGVPDADCRGAARAFIGSMAVVQRLIQLRFGDGVLSVERRPGCPRVPHWAETDRCWQVSASFPERTVCMVIARQKPEFAEGQLGFGQVGGERLTRGPGVGAGGWPACDEADPPAG